MKILRKALIIMIAFPAVTHPMQWVKGRLSEIAAFAAKPQAYAYATKARNIAAAGPLSFTYASYLIQYGLLHYLEFQNDKMRTFRAINPSIHESFIVYPDDFVKQELGKHIGTKCKTFSVLDIGHYGIMNAFSKYGITVDGNELAKALKKSEYEPTDVQAEQKRQAVQQKLLEIKGVLAHEANHVKHYDMTRALIAQTSATVATSHLFNRLSNRIHLSMTQKTVAQVPLCGLQIVTNVLLFRAWDRFREQQADDAIPNDPSLLKGMLQFLQHAKSEEKNYPYINSCGSSYLQPIRPHKHE